MQKKKSDPSILRDMLFQKIGFLTERLCQKIRFFQKITGISYGFLTEWIDGLRGMVYRNKLRINSESNSSKT
jgi:hypothetical protein